MNDFEQYRQVRVVLFDAVGTLLYPSPPVEVVYHEAGCRWGSKYSREEIRQRFLSAFLRHHPADATSDLLEKNGWQSLVAEVFDDVQDAANELFLQLWEHFAKPASWRIYDDVEPAWMELERCGFVVGVASNFDSRLNAICRGLRPLDRAAHVYCSSSIGFPKPRPEFFDIVQGQLGMQPHEILLIGDNPSHDTAGARAAGWHGLLVNRASIAVDEPNLAALTELPKLLSTSSRAGNAGNQV